MKESGNSSANPICSICFEDLKPIIEELQSISICGHVFHELCLQQWFEYCPNTKKRTCPVCKQACTNANVGRLYFQSVSDSNDSNISQKQCGYERSHEDMQNDITKLERKVVALTSSLEQQHTEYRDINEQLVSCKEQLKREVALKDDAMMKMLNHQKLLKVKTDALDKSTVECMKLQEKNMALAKELAATKLACDVELEEDEIMKLASFGNEVGSIETVRLLRKTLVTRNKSYKELMAKCNSLGRGEAKYLHKLEKAEERILKLKLRVQELENTLETKENAVLRGIKYQRVEPKTDSGGSTRPATHASLDEEYYAFGSLKANSSKPVSVQSTMGFDSPVCTGAPMDLENGHSVINWGTDAQFSVRSSPAIDTKTNDVVVIDEEKSPVLISPTIRDADRSSVPLMEPGIKGRLGGDLIAVGADGRGGRIKVMRQPLHEHRTSTSFREKKTVHTFKPAMKLNQRQGHLQIEHFFSKKANDQG